MFVLGFTTSSRRSTPAFDNFKPASPSHPGSTKQTGRSCSIVLLRCVRPIVRFDRSARMFSLRIVPSEWFDLVRFDCFASTFSDRLGSNSLLRSHRFDCFAPLRLSFWFTSTISIWCPVLVHFYFLTASNCVFRLSATIPRLDSFVQLFASTAPLDFSRPKLIFSTGSIWFALTDFTSVFCPPRIADPNDRSMFLRRFDRVVPIRSLRLVHFDSLCRLRSSASIVSRSVRPFVSRLVFSVSIRSPQIVRFDCSARSFVPNCPFRLVQPGSP